MKALLACLAPMQRAICTLVLSPCFCTHCSTVEVNAGKHSVSSEMFSVTDVRGRLASGLASLIANTHRFHVTALGQMSHLRYKVPIGKNSSLQRRNSCVLCLQIIFISQLSQDFNVSVPRRQTHEVPVFVVISAFVNVKGF